MKHILEISIAVVSGVVFIAVAALLILRGPSAPLHYTESEYVAESTELMPGDTLVYTPTLEVRHAGRVTVFRSYWDRGRDTAARLCNGESAPTEEILRNLPAGIVGNVRGGRSVREIIPSLPPGDYLLLTSAVGPDGGQSVYQVAFSIRKKC